MDAQAHLVVARHELARVLMRSERHSGQAHRLATGAADAAARLGVTLSPAEPEPVPTARRPSGSRGARG
jgi:hypothetical protein